MSTSGDGGGRTAFVIEDDAKIRAVLVDYLTAAGYRAMPFSSGTGMIAAAGRESPDVILIDRMLPDGDGLALCRMLRTMTSAPIIFLTARVAEEERLEGLIAGADDYVCKPFSPREVLARVAGVIRRAEGRVSGGPGASLAPRVDEAGRRVTWRRAVLALSPSEFEIVAALVRRPGRVFTRAELLDRIGERTLDSSDRAIDSHVKNARRKIAAIDPMHESGRIVAVYGVGYRFEP